MILKLSDTYRNADMIEVDCVKIRRAKECVHINYVDLDGKNQHATVNADTGWTRAFIMDQGKTCEVVKHEPELVP
jgi:hypothetical protein